MKVGSFGEAFLNAVNAEEVKEFTRHPNSRCYRYKWVIRGFWDFQLRQQGIPPGISYSNMSNASDGNMTMHDHSLARAMVYNAI